MTVLASVSLATFLVTGLAATQFRSQPLASSNRLARDEALRQSVNQLEDQNRALKARVQALQAEVKAGEDESARRSSAVQQVKALLDEQKAIAGLTALHGPGLTIVLRDGVDPNDPADRSLGWTIHYQDLQDIVSLLWASGAEAVAVNGQRVVPSTSFHYAGVNILINNANRLTSPYTVTALGDPSTLANGVGDPDQLAELKSRTVARTLASQDNTSVALLINDLNRANNQLIQQAAALSLQETQLRQALTAGGADAQTISKELQTLRAVTGAVPVHGPGLQIRIMGPIMDFELQDLLNSLRAAGGEAFSLNGSRMIGSTPIASRGNTLMIGGHAVSAPLVLLVIGDPEQLEPAADLSASSLQTRVQVDIQRKSEITITEVISARPLIYAQLGR